MLLNVFRVNALNNSPAHHHGHTLDLVLNFGVHTDEVEIQSHNPILFDHFYITLHLQLLYPACVHLSLGCTQAYYHFFCNFIDVLQPYLDFDISASHLFTDGMADGLAISY